MMRRTFFLTGIAALGIFLRSGSAGAQETAAGNDFSVYQMRPKFYVISGAGANIGVQIGSDGVVLVDAGSAAMTPKVIETIKKLTPEPIRYIIDTGSDPDHVGGNEALAKAGEAFTAQNNGAGGGNGGGPNAGNGATIEASEEVLNRMSAPTGKQSPYPSEAWPYETLASFQPEKPMYMNDEGIAVMREPNAHTDGDLFVFCRKSDVIMAGDILDTTRFPVINVEEGGSIQGESAALNTLVRLAIPSIPLVWKAGGTLVVPGHGFICDQADVVEYRDMVVTIRDIIQDLIKKGKTLEQIKEADPTKAYRTRYGADKGPWTTDMFVEAVYKSLTAGKK